MPNLTTQTFDKLAMWTCNNCNLDFKNTYQKHNCGAQTVENFLFGKTNYTLTLFEHLVAKFEEIGPISLHATRSMIVFKKDKGFAYVVNLGKNFVDVVLPFKEPYEDNLCFRKIALVSGSSDYNHHLRIIMPEDINEEVFDYMKKAYANGKNL